LVIFTSFYDDECGGDTNGDGNKVEFCSTAEPDDARNNNCPRAGCWGQIIFEPSSTNSVLDYVIIRYGGKKWMSAPNYSKEDYVLKIENSDLALTNSVIENNTSGFYLNGSNSQISNTIFRDHQYPVFGSFVSTGIYLRTSSPTIDSSVFLNNSLGIYIDADSQPNSAGLSFGGNDENIEDLRPTLPASVPDQTSYYLENPTLYQDNNGFIRLDFRAKNNFKFGWTVYGNSLDYVSGEGNINSLSSLMINSTGECLNLIYGFIPDLTTLNNVPAEENATTHFVNFVAGNSYNVYFLNYWTLSRNQLSETEFVKSDTLITEDVLAEGFDIFTFREYDDTQTFLGETTIQFTY